jgi:Tfp pilus assembly protein PilO
MSTPTLYPTPPAAISADEFHALEEKVLRAVEMIRSEREARLAAEVEANSLRAQLEAHSSRNANADAELVRLREERDGIRQRVEKMLRQLDELI